MNKKRKPEHRKLSKTNIYNRVSGCFVVAACTAARCWWCRCLFFHPPQFFLFGGLENLLSSILGITEVPTDITGLNCGYLTLLNTTVAIRTRGRNKQPEIPGPVKSGLPPHPLPLTPSQWRRRKTRRTTKMRRLKNLMKSSSLLGAEPRLADVAQL